MVEGPLGGGGLARAGDTCSCHMCDIVTARDESGRRGSGAGWARGGRQWVALIAMACRHSTGVGRALQR